MGSADRNGLAGLPLLICLILLLNGVQMFFISILGQYVSKDYMESKKRPIYIVKKRGGIFRNLNSCFGMGKDSSRETGIAYAP